MALTMLNLEEAGAVFDALCIENFPDEDIDVIASSVIAKMFDEPIDEILDEWSHVDIYDSKEHLRVSIEVAQGNDAVIAIHRLLYELQLTYGHTGTIVRVVLVDGRGNLILQTEEIDNDSYNFKRNWENSIVHYPCY